MSNKVFRYGVLAILFAGLSLLTIVTLFKDLLVSNFIMIGLDVLVIILTFIFALVNFTLCAFYHNNHETGR